MLIATTCKRQASWSFTNVTKGLTKAGCAKSVMLWLQSVTGKGRKSRCRGCERVVRYRLPCTLKLRANGRINSKSRWPEWELLDSVGGGVQTDATCPLTMVTSNDVASVCTGLYCQFNCE